MEQYLQHSLCNLIMDYVPASEQSEVCSIIGEALIDFYKDLCTEVETWEQIWRDSLSTRQGILPKTVLSPLADPPAIKALLKAEIQLLLMSVRERAARQGRDEDKALSRFSPNVVSYALGDASKSPRSTAENRDTPRRSQSRQSQNGSRSSSRLSISSLEDEIEVVKTKLNVLHVDEVVSHLQSVLMEDCEALKKKIQSLQECVEQAHYSQADGELREPTVTELREERKVIQMDLEQQTLMRCSASPDKAASQGLQALSRQRTGCRDRNCDCDRDCARMCHNPVPPSASSKFLPRPPSSKKLPTFTPEEQLSAPHPHRIPGRPPSPNPSACLPGPATSEAPERLRERVCSPDALLPHLRRRGSRLGEPSLAPLVSSPSSSPSDLGIRQRVGMGEHQQGGHLVDANLVCDKLDQLSLWSGKDVRPSCRDASTRPLSHSTKVMAGCPAKELSPEHLVPCPPVSQKPANKGQSVARRLGLSQLDRLVSPS